MVNLMAIASVFKNTLLKKTLVASTLVYLGYLLIYLQPSVMKAERKKTYSVSNPSVTLRTLNQYLEIEPTANKRFRTWPQQLIYHNFDLHVHHRILENDTSEKIPHIIHQTWATQSVPNRFVPLVEKWLVNHRKWQYWFWTDEDGDRLAKVMFPTLYPLYRRYVKSIQRVDVMKYMILYVFGGVFADLDLESIMPLDQMTRLHFSFIAQEPELHSTIIWGRRRMPSNALMAARPLHPFFKLLLQSLEHSYSVNPEYEVGNMTGQEHMNKVLLKYDAWMNGSRNIQDTVYLAPPAQFMPNFAAYALDSIKNTCRKRGNADKLIHVSCKKLWKSRFISRIVPGETYTRHLWAHSNSNPTLFLDKNDTNRVDKIRPSWGQRANIQSVLDFAELKFEKFVW